MRHHPYHDLDRAISLGGDYAAHQARVNETERRMRAITGRPHTPAEARVAAHDLTLALREATAAVAAALQATEPGPAPPHHRPRHATRAVPAEIRTWSAELFRLTDIGVWLRRTTLDDLGVHLPATVRIGSRAASGPHNPGLDFEPADLVAATLHQPRIGVDLPAAIDGEAAPAPRPATVTATTPRTA
ncbi:MAG TPA: hypothetical protein VNG13_00635 [Mycobacteriales bacterium]|nr:hypothetical protein [Mycobacteriales bacterium]